MYKYEKEKPKLFTEEGLETFTAIRDHVRNLLSRSGVVTMEKAMAGAGGDSFVLMAAVDHLAERDELQEVFPIVKMSGQHRLFMPGSKWRA